MGGLICPVESTQKLLSLKQQLELFDIATERLRSVNLRYNGCHEDYIGRRLWPEPSKGRSGLHALHWLAEGRLAA